MICASVFLSSAYFLCFLALGCFFLLLSYIFALTSVGALYVNNSASVLVSGCTFEDTSVSSTFGGGAIYVESEEGSSSAQSSTTQTYLHVSSSTFHRSTAFLGTAIYNSLAIVTFDNSFVAADDGEGDPSNRFFDAAQSATCTSSCGRNQYGNCSLLGTSCASCFIDSCYVSATIIMIFE